MEKPEELLSEALREVDWINFGRTIDSLVRGIEWAKWDKNFIKPSFEKALSSSKWLLDNIEELDKLFKQLEAEAKEKRKRGPREKTMRPEATEAEKEALRKSLEKNK